MTLSELVARLVEDDCIESDNLEVILSLDGGEIPPVKIENGGEDE